MVCHSPRKIRRNLSLYTVAGAVTVTILETPGPGVKLLTLAFFAMTTIVSPARTWDVSPSWNCTELGIKFWGKMMSAVKVPFESAIVCGHWLRLSDALLGKVGGVLGPPRTVA